MDTKSPDDTELDTPPHTAQPINHLSPPKNHLFICRRDQQLSSQTTPTVTATYKQCMKNHAAAIGGHAVDGCGEFMPSPSSTVDLASLTCAACGCHRNFHRRDVPNSPSPTAAITPPFLDFRHPKRFSPSPSPPPHPVPPHVFFSAAAAAAAAATAEDNHQAPVTPTVENPVGSRKRFRTRFSQEQKEKMHSFSVKLGWKLQKCDDVAVREFCHEIGVSKGVLKVWMHNNKNTFGKKEINGGAVTNDSGSDTGGGGNRNENGNGVHFNGNINGCSSSPA